VAYEVEWAESAIAGLIDAIEYISRDSPSYAAVLAVSAERAGASLDHLAHRGRRVPEFNDPFVRELTVGSYRLIYRVRATKVSILAFIHSARDLSRLLETSEP
jgi:plasmid stabilization system protein ParE